MRLFGTSGIRGEVFKKITPELCFDFGKAIASTLPEKSNVAIATDTRVTRDLLKSALISGLLTCNVNTVDIGIAPTPVLAFLSKLPNYDTGVMITASHNPPEHNGIKLWCDGMAYTPQDEQRIEDALQWKRYRKPSWNKIGMLKLDYDAKMAHEDELLERIKIQRRFKVVVDPGNGAAARYAATVFKKAGLEVLPINDEPDGLFPNRNPEPTAETIRGALLHLQEKNADIAICFDGDADRVVFCDPKGFIGYNEAIAYISRLRILQEKNKRMKKVVTTLETGLLLDHAIEDVGGEVLRGRVGDGYVGHTVRDEKASIGVEQVGVYIMPELGYYPDSIYAALYLLANIESVSEIRDFFHKIPPHFFDKKRVDANDSKKYKIIEQVWDHLDAFPDHHLNPIDGLRLDFDDSWILIRASGTQPLIKIIAESKDKDKLEKLMRIGAQVVNIAKKEVP